MKALSTIIIVLIVASLGLGVTSAQEPQPDGQDRIGTILEVISNATGLAREDIIRMSQEDGKTLAEIITENGGDVNAVQAELVAAFTADVDARISDLLNNPLPRPQRDNRQDRRGDNPILGALVGTIVEMSDLEPGDIGPQLAEGVTLAEVATSAGLNPDDVAANARAKFEERLNEAVANDRISAEDAATRLAEVTEQLATYLNTPVPDIQRGQRQKVVVGRAILGAAATNLSVEPREVLTSITPDQTMAQYVTENGGDLSAVTNEARTQLVTGIEEAVTENRITREQADELLASLDGVIEEVLNTAGAFQPRPPRDGRGGPGAPGGPQQPPQQQG